jgi:excisionase family DNA binding protein
MTIIDQLQQQTTPIKVSELAGLLNVSIDVIYTLTRRNEIPTLRIGDTYRFDPKAIAKWLQRAPVNAHPTLEVEGQYPQLIAWEEVKVGDILVIDLNRVSGPEGNETYEHELYTCLIQEKSATSRSAKIHCLSRISADGRVLDGAALIGRTFPADTKFYRVGTKV